jgi:hypothetical protein
MHDSVDICFVLEVNINSYNLKFSVLTVKI